MKTKSLKTTENIDFDEIESIHDLQLGTVVDVMNWGEADKMQVIGYDEPTDQVQVQWLDAYGSCYYTIDKLKYHQQRARKYYDRMGKSK